MEKPVHKKQVDYLYIDADEDHVSLQFQKKKGDLEKDSRGYKKNCAVAKRIYVYEGIAVIADYETTESGKRRVREAGDYFLSNWSAA